ncbi:MAG: hypothetical protein RIE53_01455 [Rhodothermales bacterium]
MHTLLETTLNTLRHHVGDAEALNADVSAWSVGMHVEHCALAMAGMATKLADSVDPDREPSVLPAPPVKWSVPRVFVSVTGTIPRGKGKAPTGVVPEPSPPRERILNALDVAEACVEAAVALPEEAWYDHHVFGSFQRNRALWFMGVHNRHHLKIIRDILK